MEPQEFRAALTALDASAWPTLGALASHTGPAFLDLTDVQSVTPAGVAALLLVTRSRQRVYTILDLPSRRSPVFKYLVEINLVHLVRFWCGTRFAGPQDCDRSPAPAPGSLFSQTLISIDEPDAAEGLMTSFLAEHYPDQATPLRTVLTELLNNLRDHPKSPSNAPFYCVQMHALKHGLQIAFGDLGPGFRTTLARNPDLPPYPSEADALHAAVVEARSSLSHVHPTRGGGLRRALTAVKDLGGHYRVLSIDGAAHLSDDGTPAFGTSEAAFPGTVTWINLPRTR